MTDDKPELEWLEQRKQPYSKADVDISDPRHQRKVRIFLLAMTLPWILALGMMWFAR